MKYLKIYFSFVFVADLCDDGHFGRHLGLQYSCTVVIMGNNNPDMEYIKLDSSFAFVADVWAEI